MANLPALHSGPAETAGGKRYNVAKNSTVRSRQAEDQFETKLMAHFFYQVLKMTCDVEFVAKAP
jgi:hypothetical protein